MATIQTFYLHTGGVPSVTTLPAGYFAAWNQIDAVYGGSAAKSMDATAGSAQVGATKSNWTGISRGTAAYLGMAQCLSPPLAAQSASAGSWTIALAFAITNATATHVYTPEIAIYLVNGATGAARTTIRSLLAIGAIARSITSERTAYLATSAGGAFTAIDGDYLALEVGIYAQNTATTGGAWAPASAAYSDGTVAITTDSALATSAMSRIVSPVALTLKPPIIPRLPAPFLSGRVC